MMRLAESEKNTECLTFPVESILLTGFKTKRIGSRPNCAEIAGPSMEAYESVKSPAHMGHKILVSV